MNKKNFKILKFLILAVALTSSACSFKTPNALSGAKSIQISLPKQLSSRSLKPRGSSTSGPNPQSFSDFNCYAINITGDGIPADPRLACGDPAQGMGAFAGFVPSGTDHLTLLVPNGANRKVQLVGVQSTVGCPDMNALLNSNTSNSFQGISSPFLLGSASLDVFNDAQVDITASFDVNNPQRVFQGCGNGDSGPRYPASLGYTGSFTNSNGIGSMLSSRYQSVLTAAQIANPLGDLSSGAAISSSNLVALLNSNGDSTNPLPGIVSSLANGSVYRNASVRLLWDTANFNILKYPYANLELEVRGGAEDGCAVLGNNGVDIQVWAQGSAGSIQKWISPRRADNTSSSQQWYYGGGLINLPISQLMANDGASHNYIVVDITSNYAAPSTPIYCRSAVYLSHASLQLVADPASKNSGTLYLGSSAERGSGANSFITNTSSTVPVQFFGSGGTPPYTFSISNGTPLGIINSSTGIYTYSTGAPGTDTIKVTDAKGQSTSANLGVFTYSASAIVGIQVAPNPSSSGPFAVGSCVPLTISTAGMNGLNPTGSPTATISTSDGSAIFYTAAGCSSGSTGNSNSPSLSSGSATIYYKPMTAGSNTITGTISGGALVSTPMPNSTATITAY